MKSELVEPQLPVGYRASVPTPTAYTDGAPRATEATV